MSFGEHEGLEGALADVVIVDDLRAVPAEFTGLAVTREGEYYRPADGQIGLASGVPAALLLERRASLERLGEKLDAVSAREAREETAVTLAAARRTSVREASAAAATAEREARISAEAAERGLAQVRSRRRDLEEHLQRDRRAVEGMAVERAEAAAGKETADAAAAGALLQTEQLRPAAADAEAALHQAEATHSESLALVTRRRVELEERRAAAARAAERREAARRAPPPTASVWKSSSGGSPRFPRSARRAPRSRRVPPPCGRTRRASSRSWTSGTPRARASTAAAA